MKIVIIEDSAEDAKLLKLTLEEYAKKNGQKMSVASYPCPGDYLKAGIEKPDALFLDIDMPGMSGMEFAKKIRAENDETIIVFVTNMVQYALDGYSVDVTDFLLKPVTYAGVERGMKKVLSRLGKRKAFLVPISDVTGKTIKYLSAADIQYVESSGHKVIYHTINGDITEWSRLQNVEEKLPADSFARSHVSFLINLDKVKSLDGDTVTLKDGAANLPVSRSQKKIFYARLAKYLGEKKIMFDFGSAIFWYKIIFVTELIAVEGVFVPLLKEREKLGLRLGLSVVCLYAAALLFPVPEYSPFFICLLFFGLFLVNLAGMFVCFKEKPQALLFVGIFAYTVQHFSYMTASYIMSLFGVDVGSVYEGAISPSNTASLLVGVAVFLPVFCLSFFYIKSITKGLREISVNGLPLVVISIIALSVNVILNSVVISAEPPKEPLLTVYFVYDLVSCVMIIGLLTTSLLNKTLRREMDVMAFKMEKSKESYELKKDKIDKINIMCHDLKHRITELEDGGYASEKLKKLEDVIKRYDSVYSTGNETLNVVLAGFGEKCEKRGVTFICVADGSALEFMKEDHIYSLFDNVLSNAYEATEKIETEENRYIKLQLERREMLVTLHVENTFLNAEEMVFDGDLPVTTKKDGDWHGLGMKSIKMIVDYYDGGFNFSVNGNIFCVDAFFPASQRNA